ncbi:MAG: class I SAM-dependent methyltransferase [Flavobacteriia bacterium]|jgi:2-polyprenyl-3-methyl-5-hydroxy-6-metoxy-1,4-benzoquinol methylase
MKSPLTQNHRVKLIKKFNSQDIAKKYKSQFGVDVSSYFIDQTEISLFECIDSKYRFFYPESISGQSDFYSKLQEFDWYYMPWKWEHVIAEKFIKNNHTLLEIGCAKGDFLKTLRTKKDIIAHGLELNKSIELINSDKIQIIHDNIQNHSERFPNLYDIVCSFQVLEHIYDVHSFIKSASNSLKKNGLLIFSVPNNDSFIKFSEEENVLNLPPHHMGHWTLEVFKSFETIFPLKLINYYFEPIQTYHQTWFDNTVNKVSDEMKNNWIYRTTYRLVPNFIKWRLESYINQLAKRKIGINGHSVLVVFEKI